MGKEKVILRRMDSYNPFDIIRIIKEGIQEFNLAACPYLFFFWFRRLLKERL